MSEHMNRRKVFRFEAHAESETVCVEVTAFTEEMASLFAHAWAAKRGCDLRTFRLASWEWEKQQ